MSRAATMLAGLLAWPMASARPRAVSGRVTDAETSEPLPGCQVLVEQGGARVGLAVTDSGGFFFVSLKGLGGNQVVVRVRRIGYRLTSREVSVDSVTPGDSLHVALERAAVQLGEEVVLGRPVEGRLRSAGVFDRARAGFGHFITEERIRAPEPRRVTDVFRGVPGVTVAPSRRLGASPAAFGAAQSGCGVIVIWSK